MYPAFMLARNGALRDTEVKTLTWGRVNFAAKTVQVGRAKSDAGEGRIVPMNSELYEALVDQRVWCLEQFGQRRTSGMFSRRASQGPPTQPATL